MCKPWVINLCKPWVKNLFSVISHVRLVAAGRDVRHSFLHQRNKQELTKNVDAAAAAGTCGNQTNGPFVSSGTATIHLSLYKSWTLIVKTECIIMGLILLVYNCLNGLITKKFTKTNCLHFAKTRTSDSFTGKLGVYETPRNPEEKVLNSTNVRD